MTIKQGISVIITTHNYEKYIEKCIQSLNSQTFMPSEIIIIDDASEDNTEIIVKKNIEKYDNSKFLYKKVNFHNAQESRKFGFNLVKYDLILFVDADNYLDVTILEKMKEKMLDNNVDLVYCDQYLIDNKGNVTGSWVAKKYSYARLKRLNFIDMCSLLKREYLQEKYFDKYIRRFQDWDIWLQYLKGGEKKAYYLNEKLIYKRYHENSITSKQEKYLEKLKVAYKNDIIFTQNDNFFVNNRIFFKCLCEECLSGSVDEYFSSLRKKIVLLNSYSIFVFSFGKHTSDFNVCVCNNKKRILPSKKWSELECVCFSKNEIHIFLNSTVTIKELYYKLYLG